MAEQHTDWSRLPPEMLAALLQIVQGRRQRGDLAGARALLRALAAQQPDDPRIWLALATVASTRDEQRRALERAIALDPKNALVRRGLARFQAADGTCRAAEQTAHAGAEETPTALPAASGGAAAIAPAPAFTPVHPDHPAREIRWPLYAVIGTAVALVLAVAVALQAPASPAAEAPTPTQTLPGVQPRSTALAARAPPHPTDAATPNSTTQPAPTDALLPATPLPATAAPPPPPATRPALAPGDVIVRKPWHASLLRPEYAVLLDGAIGTLQPRGHFALALVAVGNDGAVPARIPAGLFALVDSQGNRYPPSPAASTAYLNIYGRGQRGDVSMEENIPPGGGNVSVPLIFDVPPAARDLMLHVGDEAVGWLVGSGAGAPAPTPTP